jgi:hypothetical protein
MFSLVDKYVSLAGRACCCGRSWVGLDRSLARRGDDAPGGECDSPTFITSEEHDAEREPHEVILTATSSPGR